MRVNILGGEDVVTADANKTLVPWRLDELLLGGVDDLLGGNVTDVYFIWSDAYDGAVLLVKLVDVEGAQTDRPLVRDHPVSEARVPGTGNMAQRACDTLVDGLERRMIWSANPKHVLSGHKQVEAVVSELAVDCRHTGTKRMAITVRLKRRTFDASDPRGGRLISRKGITAVKSLLKVFMASNLLQRGACI